MSKPFQFSLRRLMVAVGLCCMLAWSVSILSALDYGIATGLAGTMTASAATIGLIVVIFFPAMNFGERSDPMRVFRLIIFPICGLFLGQVFGGGEGNLDKVAPALLGLAIAMAINYFESRAQKP